MSDPGSGRRVRATRACDGCRKTKQKCDTLHPTCSACLAQSQACTYNQKSRKRGTQPGYMATLEILLAFLLEKLPDGAEAAHKFMSPAPKITDQECIYDSATTTHLRLCWRNHPLSKEINSVLASDALLQLNSKCFEIGYLNNPDEDS